MGGIGLLLSRGLGWEEGAASRALVAALEGLGWRSVGPETVESGWGDLGGEWEKPGSGDCVVWVVG